MLTHRLKGIGLPIHASTLLGKHVASYKIVPFCLVNLCLCAFSYYSAGTYLVEVVHELRRVFLYLAVGVYFKKRRLRLILKSYIIIIGRGDYGQFTLGINHTMELPLGEHVTRLVDAF